MCNNINQLTSLGFEQIGEWKLQNNKPKYTVPTIYQTKEDLLYIFTCNDCVRYIGFTTQPFKKRMYGYQNPGTSQKTNKRVKQKIETCLKNYGKVRIYIFDRRHCVGTYQVSLGAGLEKHLINRFAGDLWNIQHNTE